jgi:DNA gyrase/topoisomerase IV subunit B
MLVEEKKRLKSVTKKKDTPEKYWPASKENKYLFLAEGDSAIGAITAEIGRDYSGFFPLRGVPLSALDATADKILKNPEIKQISTILDIDLSSNNNDKLAYENIVLAVDADVDGSHIAGVLLGLFQRFTPQYLKEGRIFLFITPLVSVVNKKVAVKFLFTMDEYQAFIDKYDPQGTKFTYDYKKGLGTMEEFEWEALFKQYKLEDLLQPLHLKDSSDPDMEIEELTKWLLDDTEFRKKKITDKILTFDVNKI